MQQRESGIDLLRGIAAFLVVLLHVSAIFSDSLWGVFYNGLTRCAVPVFLLISGRYLLGQEFSLPKLWKKCGKLLMLLLLTSAAYYLLEIALGYRMFQAGDAVWYLFTEPIHLWYLWTALGLYLFTPCLSVFCRHASKQLLDYTLVLLFLFGSVVEMTIRSGQVPILAAVVSDMKVNTLLAFPFCYLCGYRLKGYPLSPKGKRILQLLGIFGLLVTWGGMAYFRGQQEMELFLSFYAPGVLLTAVALYATVPQEVTGWRVTVGRAAARASLGVYLVHLAFLWILTRWVDLAAYPPIATIPVVAILLYLLSASFTLLWEKIRKNGCLTK